MIIVILASLAIFVDCLIIGILLFLLITDTLKEGL